MIEDIRIEKARRKFVHYVRYLKPKYELNWHHELLADQLQQWYEGKIKRLIVEMPPGHAKSEYCSKLLPSWLLGKEPDENVIATSYSEDLVKSFKNSVTENISDERYCKIFPETRIDTSPNLAEGESAINNALEFRVIKKEGGYKCAGVGGSLTGRRAKFLILDDPFKNDKEADSAQLRQDRWNWFSTVFLTRMKGDDSRVLIVTTRWHKDDIVGRIEKEKLEGWTYLRLPAIMTKDFLAEAHDEDPRGEGQVLWPQMHSPELINEFKKTQGSRKFAAVYQQQPTVPEGSIIKRNWLKFYKVAPAHFDRMIQSWDCAFKDAETSDFVVGGVWAKKGGDFYLLTRIRERLDLPATLQAVESMTARFPKARKKVVEGKANGPAVISSLKKKISGLVEYNPTESKVSRLNSVSPFFEAGNVYLPDRSIAPWIDEFIEELIEFPNGSHDDQVDFTSQALIELGDNAGDALKNLVKE
jgi:predicted phage terminase large subunit-like protein